MKSNFIKEQLIARAEKILIMKKAEFDVKLLHFEKPITGGIFNIESISLLPNRNGCITPVLWEQLSGYQVITIQRLLSKDRFFYYKNVQGQQRKLRPKRKNVNTKLA